MAEPTTPPCGTCAGTGAHEGDPCPTCGGSGKRLPRYRVPPYAGLPVHGGRCPDYPGCAHWACHGEPDPALEELEGPEPRWLAEDADAAHQLLDGDP